MSKDTYYFSHDYNARNDKKISALVREYKSAGYGIFWATAEMLHEEGGEVELDDLTLSAISKDLNEDFNFVKAVIEKCISSFKLFCLSDDNILTANRVRRNLDKRNEISKKRSDAGKAGANAKQMQANAEQKEAKEIKERKEKKEIKENVFIQFAKAEHFNGLPEIKIGAVQQLFKITKQTDLSNEQITGLWEVFKIQNLTGKKPYSDADDVYSHFINWSKTQKIEIVKNKKSEYLNENEKKLEKFKGLKES